MDAPELRVGYARVEFTPPVGSPLSDAPLGHLLSGKQRLSDRIRDPLHARALHVVVGDQEATLVVGDLLVITHALHVSVAERCGMPVERILVAATHTHSGPGGYWKAGRAERMVGIYRDDMFERVCAALADAARLARQRTLPARLLASSVSVVGASSNRRELHGPVDPELTLLRFEPHDPAELPIDLVSFGAHPVIGSERENQTTSADFPGELCKRLEERGGRSMFFQGAVGGLSPLFSEFPMKLDPHLELMAGLLERGWERAVATLSPVRALPLEASRIVVPLRDVSCRVFPKAGPAWEVAEAIVLPLRRWMTKLGTDGRATEPYAPLHLLRLGDVALLGTPCDLGVRTGLALKDLLRDAGVRFPMAGSQCGGYVGYVMMPEDYARVPEPGFREMALYENAMSLSGWQTGGDLVDALRDALAVSRTGSARGMTAEAGHTA